MSGEVFFQTPHGRVFLQETMNPSGGVSYMGQARMDGFDWAKGDVTAVYGPSRLAYNRFEVEDETVGEAGLPTTSIVARFGLVNEIMEIECPFMVQAHYGKCQDPTNFEEGWDIILAFERARISNLSSDTLTALEPGDTAPVTLTGSVTARKIWQVKKLTITERGGSDIFREVVAVTSQDYISCGDCGYESDGNQRVIAVTASSGAGSPGLVGQLLYSTDQGVTIEDYDITSLGATEDPSDVAVAGNLILVPSEDSVSIHVTTLADMTVWVEVTDGIVNAPTSVFALSSSQVWYTGTGGYIYFTDTPGADVEVQEAGTQTAQDLNDIHGVNSRTLIAVGDSGAILVTTNGGVSWALSPTSPTLDNLLCCWMRSEYCWMVGDDGGHLWFTVNGGDDWNEIVHPNSGQGAVRSIAFAEHASSPFGIIVGDDGSNGYAMRSLDNGHSWYDLPDGVGTLPASDRLNSCAMGVGANFFVAGGLGDDALDGILVVGVA